VAVLGFSVKDGVVISGDNKGVLEYWSTETYAFPRGQVAFKVRTWRAGRKEGVG
jgi:hypothetical protein